MIGLVLGPELEQNLRRGLLLNDGNFLAFFVAGPIATVLFLCVALAVLLPALSALAARRRGGPLQTMGDPGRALRKDRRVGMHPQRDGGAGAGAAVSTGRSRRGRERPRP